MVIDNLFGEDSDGKLFEPGLPTRMDMMEVYTLKSRDRVIFANLFTDDEYYNVRVDNELVSYLAEGDVFLVNLVQVDSVWEIASMSPLYDVIDHHKYDEDLDEDFN